MKTWTHVERRLERIRLPYRVQDETLVSLDGTPVAVTVQGARDFLAAPGHPDSKRQTRCKQRSLTRYGARVLKRDGILTGVPWATGRRAERREMRRIALQQHAERERARLEQVRAVRIRLLAKPGWTSVDGVRYGR